MPINQLAGTVTLLDFWSIVYSKRPKLLYDNITFRNDNLRGRLKNTIIFTVNDRSYNSFYHRAAQLWNSIDTEDRLQEKRNNFKNHIIRWIIANVNIKIT